MNIESDLKKSDIIHVCELTDERLCEIVEGMKTVGCAMADIIASARNANDIAGAEFVKRLCEDCKDASRIVSEYSRLRSEGGRNCDSVHSLQEAKLKFKNVGGKMPNYWRKMCAWLLAKKAVCD